MQTYELNVHLMNERVGNGRKTARVRSLKHVVSELLLLYIVDKITIFATVSNLTFPRNKKIKFMQNIIFLVIGK